MSSTRKLFTIEYHDDDDTGMYTVGEVDGGYNPPELEKYIKQYGGDKLLVKLGQLAHTVVDIERNLNAGNEILEQGQC